MFVGKVANSKVKESVRTENPQSKEKRLKYDNIGGPPWVPARANVFLGHREQIKPVEGINPRNEILKQEALGRSRGHAFTILARKARNMRG